MGKNKIAENNMRYLNGYSIEWSHLKGTSCCKAFKEGKKTVWAKTYINLEKEVIKNDPDYLK